MKTLYDMIEDAVEAKAKAERFLNEGIADKTLMRLNNGTIRPRYCQYCVECFGLHVVPKIQYWKFNLNDDEIAIVRNTHGKIEWGYFWKDVSTKLKLSGYDTNKRGFFLPTLTNNPQYACFCDSCEFCSGWYFSQKDAMDRFDMIVQEQIPYAMGFDYQKRRCNE